MEDEPADQTNRDRAFLVVSNREHRSNRVQRLPGQNLRGMLLRGFVRLAPVRTTNGDKQNNWTTGHAYLNRSSIERIERKTDEERIILSHTNMILVFPEEDPLQKDTAKTTATKSSLDRRSKEGVFGAAHTLILPQTPEIVLLRRQRREILRFLCKNLESDSSRRSYR